jgi:hypothetical protein
MAQVLWPMTSLSFQYCSSLKGFHDLTIVPNPATRIDGDVFDKLVMGVGSMVEAAIQEPPAALSVQYQVHRFLDERHQPSG